MQIMLTINDVNDETMQDVYIDIKCESLLIHKITAHFNMSLHTEIINM